MKRISLILSGACVMLAFAAVGASASDRVAGGDISLVSAYESAGDVWLDADGKAINGTNGQYTDGLITYFKEAGWNSMRVRLIVDPEQDDDPATCQDLTYVTALGKRIKDAGMNFLLDIFYSDTWTDVSKQWIPNGWSMDKNTATETLAAQVKSYTTAVIDDLVSGDAKPDYIQIGNEVSYGMLWDSYANSGNYTFSGTSVPSTLFYLYSTYDAYSTQITRFAALLKAAAEGVRASEAKDAKIILHSERTGDASATKNFYDWVKQADFTDYDIIGLSYYPAWQGKLSALESTLSTLIAAYPEKEIHIVETGYYHSETDDSSAEACEWDISGEGQDAFLSDLVTTLAKYPNNVTGLYYWQPEECGNGANNSGVNTVKSSWDNRGFWNESVKSSDGPHTMLATSAPATIASFLDISGEVVTTDYSSYFQNLDFESCAWNASGWYDDCPGWDITYSTFSSSTPWPSNISSDSSISSLVSGAAMEVWVDAKTSARNIATNTVAFKQTSSSALPAGTYRVSAVVHADQTSAFALYASDGTTTVTSPIPDSGTNNWGDAGTYTVEITLTSDAQLTIGVMTTEAINLTSGHEANLYADNFSVAMITYVEDDTDDDYTDTWDQVGDYFENLDFDSSTIKTDVNGNSYVEDCSPWDTTIGNSYFSQRWTTKNKIYTQTPWPVISGDVDNPEDTPSSLVKDNYMYAYTGYTEDGQGHASSTLGSVPEGTYVFFQTSKKRVPTGTYTVSAIVHADGTEAFALYANGNNEVTTAIEKSEDYGDAKRYYVTVTVTKSVYLEIGIKTTAAITDEANLYADDFRVVQDSELTEDDLAGSDLVWRSSTELYALENLDFESHTADTSSETAFPKWTVSNYATNGNYTMHCVTKDNNMSDYVDGYVFEAWIPSSYLSNIYGDFLYREVELPAGYYSVSAAVYCDNDGIYLFANDGTGDLATSLCSKGNAWKNAKIVTVSFTLTEKKTVKFGLRSTISSGTTLNDNQLNVYADDFEFSDERCVATVSEAKYATYFSNHSYLMPEGLKGATITAYSSNGNTEGVTGTLTKNWKYSTEDGDTEEVPKMTALLLNSDAKTFYPHVTSEGDGTGSMNPEDDTNILRGSATETETTGPGGATEGYKFYMLSYGEDGSDYADVLGFYYGVEGGAAFTSDAHKAWLPISESDAVKLTGFTIEGGIDNTTGITTVPAAANGAGAIYNLQGMRVNDTSKKGLYIIGGRKVMVK